MKRLLQRLGFFKKQSNEGSSDLGEASFLRVSQVGETLVCKWRIRDASKAMIARDFGSRLLIRIRDVTGDGSTSSKMIEASLEQSEVSIGLPSFAGRILVDIGYQFASDFITLEYQLLDLGPKLREVPKYIDWFTQESSQIHQEMYEMAMGGRPLGGSEMAQRPE